MKAILVLEDGSFFEGVSIGTPGERIGEVVLNTAVVGYQEMMTDPSLAGKILVFTYPLIGNYGVAEKFYESRRCWTEAVIMKQDSKMYSNWQAEDSLNNFLKKENVFAMSDADTRTIAVKIRDEGEMFGIISSKDLNKASLLKKLKSYKNGTKKNLIKNISVEKITQITSSKPGPKIAVLDLGVLNSNIRQLEILGANITLLPYNTGAEKILGSGFEGLVISNGPEQDGAVSDVVEVVKKLIGKIPILGICLGHEIIGLALGGKLKKLKVGHHGVNYPVRPPDSYKGHITVQNHSLIVDEESIKGLKGVKATLHNINDNSIEEMESKSLKFISTQYYPVSPGFDEVNDAFKRFLIMINQNERNLEYAKA